MNTPEERAEQMRKALADAMAGRTILQRIGDKFEVLGNIVWDALTGRFERYIMLRWLADQDRDPSTWYFSVKEELKEAWELWKDAREA